MSSKDNNTTGPLSQSAVASFVFSSIQLTISVIILVIASVISSALSGFSGSPSSTASPVDSINMGAVDQDLLPAIIMSAPGILGLVIAISAAYSIGVKGKSGVGLTFWSVLMSSIFVGINLFPALRGYFY